MPSGRRKASNRGVAARATRVKTEDIKDVKHDADAGTDDDDDEGGEPQMSQQSKLEQQSEAEDMKPAASASVKADKATSPKKAKAGQKRARRETSEAEDTKPSIKQESKAMGSKAAKKRKVEAKESSPMQPSATGSRGVKDGRQRAQAGLHAAAANVKQESSTSPRKSRRKRDTTPPREEKATASPADSEDDEQQDSDTLKKDDDSEEDELQSGTETMGASSQRSNPAAASDRILSVKREVKPQIQPSTAAPLPHKQQPEADDSDDEDKENVSPRYTRQEKGKGRAKEQDTKVQNPEQLKIELENMKKQLQAAHATLESQRGALDKINELHTCNICLETLRNPLALACGHVFCQNDLWNWFHRTDPDEEQGHDSEDYDDSYDSFSGSQMDVMSDSSLSTSPSQDGSNSDDEDDGDESGDGVFPSELRGLPGLIAVPRGYGPGRGRAGYRGVGQRASTGYRLAPLQPRGQSARDALPASRAGGASSRPRADLLPVPDDVDTDDSVTSSDYRRRAQRSAIMFANNPVSVSAFAGNNNSRVTQTVTFPRVLANPPSTRLRQTAPSRELTARIHGLPYERPGRLVAPTAEPARPSIAQAPAAAAATAAAGDTETRVSATPGPSHRIPARDYPNRRNLVCPHCRMKISIPPFPIFMVREISDLMRARSTGRRESSLDLERANDAIADPTWGGLFPRAASGGYGRIDREGYYRPVGPGSVRPEAFATRTAGAGQEVRRTGQMVREDREHQINVDRVRQRIADVERRQRDVVARTRRAEGRRGGRAELICDLCEDREEHSHDETNGDSGDVSDRSGPANMRRHPIAAVARRARRDENNRDVNRYGMRDAEDGVRRCVDCNWEIENGRCENCGIEYDSDSEFDDAGDPVDHTATSPQYYGESRRINETSETNQEEEADLSDFIVSDRESPARLSRRRQALAESAADSDSNVLADGDMDNESEVDNDGMDVVVEITDNEGEGEGEDLMADAEVATEDESLSGEDEAEGAAVLRLQRNNRDSGPNERSKKRNIYAYSSEEEADDDEEEDDDGFIDDAAPQPRRSREPIDISEDDAEETDKETRRARREERRQARDAQRISRHHSNQTESDFSGEDSEDSSTGSEDDDDGHAEVSIDTQHTSPPDEDSDIEEIESQATSRQKREKLAAAAEKRLARQAESGDSAAMTALARSNVEKRNKVSGSNNRTIVNGFHDHVSQVVRNSTSYANASSSGATKGTRPGYKKRVIDESEDE